MEKKIKYAYGVVDTHLNSRAKYKYISEITAFNIPKKHIDTGKPFYYTYYFSTKEKRDGFANELAKKYKLGK